MRIQRSITFKNKSDDEKDAIRKKIKATTKKNYGVECYMQSEEFKKAQLEYIKSHGGTDNVSQIKEVRDKVKATNLKNCGYESNLASPDTLIKKKETYIAHYGVDHNMKSKVGYQEWLDSFMANNGGIINPFNLSSSKQRHQQFIANKRITAILYNDHVIPLFDVDSVKDEISLYGNQYWWQCLDCGHCFAARVQSWSDEYITSCPYCKMLTRQNNHSMFEVEVFNFIKELFPDKKIIYGINNINRHVIPPYELDIWMPDDKIAIECDGLFWHSIDFIKYESSNFSKMFFKTKLCEAKGINLIHIYQDEWYINRDNIKTNILNIVNKNFNFTTDTITLPRCFYSINTVIPNYQLVNITEPILVNRHMPNKNRVYKLYDCGNLIFERERSK